MRSATPETSGYNWMMHYIRHAVPYDKPHIGCEIEDWAVPDGSRLLRSELVCAVSLMMERMIRPEYVEHKICPVSFLNAPPFAHTPHETTPSQPGAMQLPLVTFILLNELYQ